MKTILAYAFRVLLFIAMTVTAVIQVIDGFRKNPEHPIAVIIALIFLSFVIVALSLLWNWSQKVINKDAESDLESDLKTKVECQEIIMANLRETLDLQRVKNTQLSIELEKYRPVQGNGGKFIKKASSIPVEAEPIDTTHYKEEIHR